jgi:hypothetical protein
LGCFQQAGGLFCIILARGKVISLVELQKHILAVAKRQQLEAEGQTPDAELSPPSP